MKNKQEPPILKEKRMKMTNDFIQFIHEEGHATWIQYRDRKPISIDFKTMSKKDRKTALKRVLEFLYSSEAEHLVDVTFDIPFLELQKKEKEWREMYHNDLVCSSILESSNFVRFFFTKEELIKFIDKNPQVSRLEKPKLSFK
jgi:hypothetical protein